MPYSEAEQATPPQDLTGNPSSKPPGIYIYVDNSNIWIVAKKMQSAKQNLQTKEDHRIRIDVGKLAAAIANHRTISNGIVYGSIPPPTDSVWNKMKGDNFEVKCKKRSTWTGKEKQVDAEMSTDITTTAIKTPSEKRSTIVLVSGDGDFIPCLESVLKEERWTIEVYTWKDTVASDLRKLASQHKERVTIKELDDYMDKFTFKEMEFKMSGPLQRQKIKQGGMVFTMENHENPTQDWCDELEHTTLLPFQYYWFKVSKKRTDHLVIIFQKDKLSEISFTSDQKTEMHYLPKVRSVRTFKSFSIEIFQEEHLTSWQAIDRALEQVEKKLCSNGKECSYGLKCSYHHSEKDMKYFQR